jgi:PPOX class probable F420-dependent enzyme
LPSRREQIEMTDEEVHEFLAEKMVMQCATNGPRGLPHLVPLWFVKEGTDLIGWTYARSQKAKNLERDPRATIGLEEGVGYQELRGVTLECDVELEKDPARVEEVGLELFARYGGDLGPEIRQMVAAQAQKRVGLRFVASRVISWDHRKLGGTY